MAKNTLSKGFFITFEGPDGCGKTSVAQKVYEELAKQYPDQVVFTREPGGKNNIIAEDIRRVLLNHLDYKIDYRSEALLFAASRAQHVSDFIIPNLKQNHIVLCDRYIHSSLVYQGFTRELGFENVLAINKFAIQNTMPDLVILIMADPETCWSRIKQHRSDKVDRLDQEEELHEKVYQGYLKLIKQMPENLVVINGENSIDNVAKEVLEKIKQLIK
ncbi:MAG: dTMP kinase [Mycoplasma sp.]